MNTTMLSYQFHDAMIDVWRRAKKETGYDAKWFLSMVMTEGGEATAHKLLHGSKPQSGFTKLWELGKLDLTMEALVRQEKWKPLFSKAELEIALNRLLECKFVVPAP